jgi:TrmH family RNA methyltransferase
MSQVDYSLEILGNFLKAVDSQIYLADKNGGKPYERVTFSRRVAIVLGSERSGIDREWYRYCNTRITIPMNGDTNSLNVSAAGSVLLVAVS